MTGKDPKTGRFTAGNKFWEARSTHGVKPKFESADDLWDACVQYFNWVHDNPLYEDRLVTYMGDSKHEPVSKMRAMTISAMCLFIDVTRTTWDEWKKTRADLSDIITRTEAIIFAQKFEGASADLLNPNIIARELGLADKKIHGNDPENPMPEQQVTVYQLPDNGRD
ncbi:terminase small subunit [Sulfitobacter sp. EhC04]|uniref:terminase small subunit n=1 Tax=Sulfitobacter sp. EhC04 TaxID=1849168 RepID=UPI0007F329DA|nr:terminase small subunit [Sulfitobacter sp. EhC04]OAN76745.1 terminase small subunit [Sulfitobacter sp. EhC04]